MIILNALEGNMIYLIVILIFVFCFFLIKRNSSQINDDIEVEETSAFKRNNKLPTQDIINETIEISPEISDIIFDSYNSIKIGMSTNEINSILSEKIRNKNYKAAMLNYNGYPSESSISLNDQVVHSIPSKMKISDGDLITIQTAIQGCKAFSNQGWTFSIGKKNKLYNKLINSGKETLKKVIQIIKPNIYIGDIGSLIQKNIEKDGFSIVKDFVGFGMGEKMHQWPEIPCFGKSGKGMKIYENMILNIHIIANAGKSQIRITDDSWSAVTMDGTPSILFTAMVLVTTEGNQLLTRFLD